MIREGILCETCGVVIDPEPRPVGYVRKCDECLIEWLRDVLRCELCGVPSGAPFCESCDGTMLAAFERLKWSLSAAGRAILHAMRFK